MVSNNPSFCWFVIWILSKSSGASPLSEAVCGRKERAENILFFKLLNLLSEAENQDSASSFFDCPDVSSLFVYYADLDASGLLFGLSCLAGGAGAAGWFGFGSLLNSLSSILRSSSMSDEVLFTAALC